MKAVLLRKKSVSWLSNKSNLFYLNLTYFANSEVYFFNFYIIPTNIIILDHFYLLLLNSSNTKSYLILYQFLYLSFFFNNKFPIQIPIPILKYTQPFILIINNIIIILKKLYQILQITNFIFSYKDKSISSLHNLFLLYYSSKTLLHSVIVLQSIAFLKLAENIPTKVNIRTTKHPIINQTVCP